MRFFCSFAIIFAISALSVLAQESVDQAMEMVRATCQVAKDEGSFSSVVAKGDIDGNVRVRLVGRLDADAFVELTEEEWSSIRQVLKTDQLADNRDYRACVRELTPIVLEKMP